MLASPALWSMPHSTLDQRLYKLLGQTIADKRNAKPLTQEQLAVEVGLKRASIANIECGRQHIQLHTLYMLAKALDIEVLDLLPARKSVESAAGSIRTTLSKEEWLRQTISGELQ